MLSIYIACTNQTLVLVYKRQSLRSANFAVSSVE